MIYLLCLLDYHNFTPANYCIFLIQFVEFVSVYLFFFLIYMKWYIDYLCVTEQFPLMWL